MTFERESVKHPLAARRLSVSAVNYPAPSIARITLSGDELEGFISSGPTDHVKAFFPDPATGVLTAPTMTEDGLKRVGEGKVFSRDYTPLGFRSHDGHHELDIDFVVHGDEGPASAWAGKAKVGDEIVIAGPRGSKLLPQGATHVILIADETALPAASRWIEMLPTSVRITALFDVADESVESYFSEELNARMDAQWFYRRDGLGQLEAALRALGEIGESTFVFLAGEATTLVPLRRYLRRELGLPKQQVTADGYWRRGVTDADHHAPIDPSDPED
ncbi:NADPH-dependent ferric siderophore reductase [Salinibacterium amurskyense]|uniref:NADPH-dependent ferric siderophore reductase n=1 Tax=Salinibacterium amurskyense TaxID=205941 RepID=A0A2M9D1N6_9MICO|nr:siderophore-interacting protein [Salinibacterium amurskyense]PJJ77995.1 NADPH-dependent ferric siderophore reductase [Salinibacterium amurskyense]RLQ80153.1 siderophore-interacting protein [Salinibacterium amurskyense]GHD82272.1 siderophore-interacting protein [Salinibacterium amurskyense]